MSNTLQHKRSTTAGIVPGASDLSVGELGVNTADGSLFTKHSDGTVKTIASSPIFNATNTNNVAGVWEASIPEISAYEDGQIIAFYPNKIDGVSSGTTFQINSLGAKTVTRPDGNTNAITTHYDGTNLIFLRYVAADDYFIVHANYNVTDDYRLRYEHHVTANNSAGSGTAWYGYELLMEGIDGKFYPVTEGGSSGNTNAVSTAELRVGGVMLIYSSSTNRNANANTGSYSLYEAVRLTTMEFWNNRDSGWATAYRPWYIVATINANGNFVLDNTSFTSFLTQDLPTSDDGKYYIHGGLMLDTYDDYRLQVNHPIYVYKNGAVREWSGYANSDRILEVTGSSATGSGQLQLNCENNSHGVKIKGPPHSAGADYTLTLPNDDGSSGQALITDGSGGLSWTTVSTSGYSNSNVDTHLNQGTASTNDVLSWNGSDYTWVAQSSGGGGSGGDAATLDGIDSSSFLRSDATDSATGAVTFSNLVKIDGALTGNYANLGIYNSSYSTRYIYMGMDSDTDQVFIKANPDQYTHNRYLAAGISGNNNFELRYNHAKFNFSSASSGYLQFQTQYGSVTQSTYYGNSGIGNWNQTNDPGLVFLSGCVAPANHSSYLTTSDNILDFGKSNARWDDIYATNGTIQTSDSRLKQDVAVLTTAEMNAANRVSKLFKTYRWIDAVEAKGDAARCHTGVIAQEVKQAFTDEGLDVHRYAFFIFSEWWTDEETVAATDEMEEHIRPYFWENEDEVSETATYHSRYGIRYPELLSFLAAYNEQRLTSIEARLDALEE